MSPVQMNVRIDRSLKENGDAAFADYGYTPTEIVREVWGFACRNRCDRRVMAEFVRSLRDPRDVEEDNAARADRLEQAEKWLDRGPRIIREHFAQADIDYDSLPPLSHDSYEDLLEEAYADKYPELWSV